MAFSLIARLARRFPAFRSIASAAPAAPDDHAISAEAERLKSLSQSGDRAVKEGRLDAAQAAYLDVLRDDPHDLYVIYRLASLQHDRGDLAAAAITCDAGLTIDPAQVALLHRRASVATSLGDYSKALAMYERIREVAPDFEQLDAKFADTFAMLGRGEDAMAAFERAIAREPTNAQLKSDRLFVMNYFKLADRQRLFDAHRSWGAEQEALVATERRAFANDRSTDRKLKIGYVSADLRNHAVAYFMRGVLSCHDRTRFEIQCFDVSPYAEDSMTAEMRRNVDKWHRVAKLSDANLAERIRGEAIDVLVDLSGHTAHNRLLTFARKPAPVQVSWFGYMNTTGLRSIDYRITDNYMDPVGQSDRFYTEKLFRIPSMACFSPHPASPGVGPMPASGGGVFTFASVNQWTKVSDEVKALWASILASAPNSRLLVVARGGEFPGVRDEVISQFVRHGAKASQVAVSPSLPIRDFLGLFRQVDVALDPFPYGGGTTSLHTIWMGVPIISLEGDSEMSRAASGILRAVGMDEWIARDAGEYRALALRAVVDPARVDPVRADLRERMRRSSLMDAKGLTRSVEAAYRTMWHAYSSN